jgi:Na+-transporting methylmalonyl-CoA/oxaloacetate decarboxylase gamma subunit
MDNDGFLAVADSAVNAVSQTDAGVIAQAFQETAVQVPDTQAVAEIAAQIPDTSTVLQIVTDTANAVAANSAAVIDFARVSVQMGKNGLVNGWIVTFLGMVVVGTCLLLISFVISFLPKVLILVDKYFPENPDKEKSGKKEKSATSPAEAVAAAIAVSYHNYHNNGK